jgi:hypothetical protein
MLKERDPVSLGSGDSAMNTTRLRISLVALLLCAPLAYAEAPAAADKPADAAVTQQMQRMQDNMKNMQAMMAKINASKDPAERQKLMQEHAMAMHAQMQMMGGMGGMGGSQMGMMNGGNMMKGGGMMSGDTMQQHQAMMGRMAMMEMMMGQMLQHQEAATPPASK